ncbi:hypothetical protein ABPG74_012120 [Tetrahymena malaccensis]
MYYHYYWNKKQSNQEENQLYYSTIYQFDIRNYSRRKESEINSLKLNINSDGACQEFDYFSRLIKRIPNIKELEISINIKFYREKKNSKFIIKEVLDFLIETIIPQYQDTLEVITFTQVQIQEKSEKDEEKTIKKYLLKILQPLKALKIVSFRNNLTEVSSSDFYGLKQFVSLLKEKSLALPKLKLLDFEFIQENSQVNLKLLNQKEILNNMFSIAKDLCQINQLEELQIGIQNLGLEKVFFEFLIQSIIQMKNLKKLGLDISSNRITVENSVKNVKQLQSLSNQLENFIYIDSQNLKPSNVKEFNQVMKSFQNLKFLQLEQLSFKQGQCSEFFQFLQFMPNLEEIKLDLENIYLNSNDYNFFVKQVKSLENLTSIQLCIPQEKQKLSENTVLYLVDMVTHFQGQLTDLSLVIYSKIEKAEITQLIDAISKMVKLKYIEFRFPNEGYDQQLVVNARKSNAENIWNLKFIDFDCQQNRFQDESQFLTFLKLRILINQNNDVLQEMRIHQQMYYYNQNLDEQIQNNLVKVKKFNNLKTLIYKTDTSIKNFKDLSKILIQNNFNTLTHLELSNSYNLQASEVLDLIKHCKSLLHLEITLSSINNAFLKQIFSQLVFLQKLYINQVRNFIIDQKVFQYANYLTDFLCSYTKNFGSQNMINERKVYILQNIIYSQIIQPYIIYQPQFSHLDIVLN